MIDTNLTWAVPRTTRYEAAATRLRPIFRKIEAGSVDREVGRSLPYEQIGWLKAAGFGALRIPAEDGGEGLTLPELVGLMTELAEADSNIPQALRAHFGAVEDVLSSRDASRRARWITRFAAGELVGSALSEAGDNALGALSTTLTGSDVTGYVLNGTKYYSTGALYADWVNFGAMKDGELVSGFVSTSAPGVKRVDDWKGFGQTLTGSGTTMFDQTPVASDDVVRIADRSRHRSSFFQLMHLATLSGIGRRAARDVAAAVAARRRTYSHAASRVPASDPQILQVVGEVRSAAYAAGAITLQAAEATERVYEAIIRRDDALAEEEGHASEIVVAQAQTTVARLVMDATALLFNALGASATDRDLALDRHWRNARTIASHNPLIYKQRIVGDWAVNGTAPPAFWIAGQV